MNISINLNSPPFMAIRILILLLEFVINNQLNSDVFINNKKKIIFQFKRPNK